MTTNADVLTAGNTPISDIKKSKSRPAKAKYFFVFMAVLFPVVTFIGFYHSYQSLKSGTLIIHWITHIHAFAMTSWLLLYFVQAVLAATGNLKIHRKLGPAFLFSSIMVLVFMWVVTIRSIIVYHPPQGSFMFDGMLIGLFEICCFVIFVNWGMLSRKKNPAAHKRFLTIATTMVLLSAVDRMKYTYSMPTFGLQPIVASFVYLDILLIPLFIYDLVTVKQVHRYTILAVAIVIALQVITTSISGTPGWHRLSYELTLPLTEKVKEIKLSDSQILPLLGDYDTELGRITISRDIKSIYVQFSGEQKKELGAISETELFLRDDVFTFHFTLGAKGDVVTAECRQIGRIYKMTRVAGQ